MTILHKDYSEFLNLLNGTSAKYLLVGAHALALYGHSRFTSDIDLFISNEPDNIRCVIGCLEAFGFPQGTFSPEDFAQSDVVQVGFAPVRIDLLTALSGVTFDDAWPARREMDADGLKLTVISPAHLIQNKRAVGRPQDLADIAALEKMELS